MLKKLLSTALLVVLIPVITESYAAEQIDPEEIVHWPVQTQNGQG